MHTHLEESLQRDMDRIRDHVAQMSQRAEKALRDCVKSFTENNRKLAYAVILRDQYVDEKEKEIDRLCQEFIVRQQPVAGHLRFANGTVKINLEIERVGDYAESIARQIIKLHEQPIDHFKNGVVELADVSTIMFHNAVQAYIRHACDLARKTLESWETADARRNELNTALICRFREQKLPFEALDPLMTIIRRFERVADQARNICLEVLHICTGEYVKHRGADTFRVLFVDDHNSCRSQIAEAIAEKLNQTRFVFSSAGIDPRPVNKTTIEFMQAKGFDLARSAPKAIHQIPYLDHYQVIVALSKDAMHAFPKRQRKVIMIDWLTDDPSVVQGSAPEIAEAYEKAFEFIRNQVHDLVEAITDASLEKEPV
jgi:phosphate transport system protein